MRFAILCYDSEEAVDAWTPAEEAAAMAALAEVQAPLREAGVLGPVARLHGTGKARTLRKGRAATLRDGPFAETKEQLLGFYVVDCADMAAAEVIARDLAAASGTAGCFEIRPLRLFNPGP